MNSRRMSNDQRYFQSYDQFHVHELMLRDRPRVNAYYDAMMNNKQLFENKIVLDVGSGTGILSMFAAKAGAKLVYAVDACPKICDLAEELIKCNGLQDRIRVINKRVEEIENFEENIDIIISEWMGKNTFFSS
jgi:predicted RNA methylase